MKLKKDLLIVVTLVMAAAFFIGVYAWFTTPYNPCGNDGYYIPQEDGGYTCGAYAKPF